MSINPAYKAIDHVYRTESRRVFATLVRLLGDLDLAEDALQEAFAAASDRWPKEGVPANPRAWLVSTGRFKGIDAIRKRARFDASIDEIVRRYDTQGPDPAAIDEIAVEDDRLRLIFTCCHPALSLEAQVALTLREVCGLSTEEIARAFLLPPTTLAQRIVRAKAKIRTARIPYHVPEREDLPERVAAVLQVVYLVFNEGYSASSGDSVMRHDLTAEAIRLGRLLVTLLPDPEAVALLALMLLHESRREARSTPAGDVILLEDQDRRLWNRRLIAEGSELAKRSLAAGPPGPNACQAAIAALHARAETPDDTDWNGIAGHYRVLMQLKPSPIVELNLAVAIAKRDGPEHGLALVDDLLARGELDSYHLAHAARADLCRRLNRADEARESYHRALALATQEPERRFLERRIRELDAPSTSSA